MKYLLLFCFISFTFNLHSQEIEGTYANKWVSNSGEGIQYNLTLHEDGQFTFEYIRIYKEEIKNSTIEVTGNWILENNLLTLKTESTDTDEELAESLDLNKARFISISPRNPNFNLVKPSLKFYESEVFYSKDMELIKTESTITSTE